MKQAAQYGLIGYPLSHSFSPGYFAAKFEREGIDAVYTALPIASVTGFPQLLADHPALKGLNVTIPYKQTIIPYLDDMDEAAEAVRAVNCIDIRDGKTKGYNTDIIGFRDSLVPLLQPHHTHALILGTGGSSLAVAYVLKELGISFQKVSRHSQPSVLTYAEIDADTIATHTLIINTTPLGMYPNIDEYPVLPYHILNTRHLLYDLIYNPAETAFLAKGKAHGTVTKNGLEMLHLQAEASWNIWSR